MSWFSRRGDYQANGPAVPTGNARHTAASDAPSRQSEQYEPKHAKAVHVGQHRADRSGGQVNGRR